MTNRSMQPVAAIVVAAGSGSRLRRELPKALVDVGGVPMVRRSVDVLRSAGVGQIVVVAHPGHPDQFRAALLGLTELTIVSGGAERPESVRKGLDEVDAPVVLVHDAARPLVPVRVVNTVMQALASGAQAVIPVVPVIDSMRRVEGEGSAVVDRAALRAVQTPQGFVADVLRAGHRHVQQHGIAVTDDASACELIGAPITFVEGDREAMKITEPLDLVLAEAMWRARS
ncbi:2-C-methyl-D-erythritol 4-phosphate cytidylyltransferase [uncultured Tessaracoccus sp.]|uniref:2-C-methyl-D-erythritol 4-phosphate cytidylyltransferase n=1 Tax=uncultured Tessaracoccus sp. TaxID=905023 RepID=UPI00262B4751|nr:2-C-methyl-D-erythritol 4-phosphate cytidylyltransferase [uncultured Tessaracoccus sp.]